MSSIDLYSLSFSIRCFNNCYERANDGSILLCNENHLFKLLKSAFCLQRRIILSAITCSCSFSNCAPTNLKQHLVFIHRCSLRKSMLYFGYLIPMVCIFIHNIVVFILVLRVIFRRNESVASKNFLKNILKITKVNTYFSFL